LRRDSSVFIWRWRLFHRNLWYKFFCF